MLNKKITVVGIGYVGLPAALLLAKAGYKVTGYDVNQEVVDSINDHTIKVEDGLNDLLYDKNVLSNFTASISISESDVFIVAVPTPLLARRKSADLTMVINALEHIAAVLKKDNLVIIESTIPPLTCKEVVTPIFEEKGYKVGDDIYLAHCPERLLPGNILVEITENSRLIGGVNEESSLRAKELYQSFVKGNIIITNDVTAELCKLMENTYRDVNIALSNEIYEVATKINVNPFEAIQLANLHPRVNILQPGIGVGGHCLPIDPWFINEIDPFDCTLIQTARRINDNRPLQIASQIRRYVAHIKTPKLLILGCSYKEETDDIRESPAIEIAHLLIEDGYNVIQYDSIAKVNIDQSLFKLVNDADCIAVLVEHNDMMQEFHEIIEKLKNAGKQIPLIYSFNNWQVAPNSFIKTSVCGY